MQAHIPSLGVLVLAAVLLWVYPSATADEGKAPAVVPTRQAIEQDLAVEASLISPGVIQPGEPVRIQAHLVNRSKTVAYPVVRPGNGSYTGWREPYLFFTAERVTRAGTRTAVPQARVERCELCDRNWHDEVTALAPNARLALSNGEPVPRLDLLLQSQGVVELKLHYRYAAGASSKGRQCIDSAAPESTGAMKSTPAFELVSAPIRVEVVRLMDIRLEVRKPMIVGKAMRLSEVAALHVENRSNDPVPVSGSEVRLELLQPGGTSTFFTSFAPIPPSVEAKTPALGGGETRTWSGATKWQALPDWRVTPARVGTFQLVASWRPTNGRAWYRSQPATVEVRAP